MEFYQIYVYIKFLSVMFSFQFEQLIKDEDVKLENLKTILKIREKVLLDRTKSELTYLEIQRKYIFRNSL